MTTYSVATLSFHLAARFWDARLDIAPPLPVAKDGTLYAADRAMVRHTPDGLNEVCLFDGVQLVAYDWREDTPARDAIIAAALAAVAKHVAPRTPPAVLS